jgi:predicted nucleotidyltransferase
LFKFDLLLDLMASGKFRQLTYVPMLTPPDSTSKEGNQLRRSAGPFSSELFHFLREHRSSADIRVLRKLFADRKQFKYSAHRDDGYYSHQERMEYFRAIESSELRAACVFLDPDIGIERGSLPFMKKAGLEKYLFLDDLQTLVERSEDSVFVVYQHLQKDAGKRLGDIRDHIEALSQRFGIAAVPFVRQDDLAFYAIARDEAIMCEAAKVFSSHAEKLDRLTQHVTDALFVVKAIFGTRSELRDLAVFGSVARGEQGPDSDIDVLASFAGPATLRGFFELQRRLELFLGRRIDLVTSKAVRSEMRPAIEQEALHAA